MVGQETERREESRGEGWKWVERKGKDIMMRSKPSVHPPAGTADLIKKVSFNDDYLSIPERPGTERFFKNQVFTLYATYIGSMPRLVQIETWFFGIIHCS